MWDKVGRVREERRVDDSARRTADTGGRDRIGKEREQKRTENLAYTSRCSPESTCDKCALVELGACTPYLDYGWPRVYSLWLRRRYLRRKSLIFSV